jgi:DNA (cytosine-5)-methyltransferase 1
LDLYCGAGGAAKGYADAGWDVTGVDIAPQPHYPYPYTRQDALAYLRGVAWGLGDGYDAIHASPPCQAYSDLQKQSKRAYPDLVAPTRLLLEEIGLPYVIENVVGAPLRDPVMLCGSMFGLGVQRHRLFETNWPLLVPQCWHGATPPRYEIQRHGERYLSRYAAVYGTGGGKAREHWATAMGITWMTPPELAQAIPPAYTEFIGAELLRQVTSTASTMVSD